MRHGRLLAALVAIVASTAASGVAAGTASAAACTKQAAELAVAASGFMARAEKSWSSIASAGFSVGEPVCGRLTRDGRRDMVVNLFLVAGTGSSPKPWAIFNRSAGGGWELAHADMGKELICAGAFRIRARVLRVYRPSEYLGAFTLCDQIVRYRWRDGRYRAGRARPSYVRCGDREVTWRDAMESYTAYSLRVAGMSCRAAVRMLGGPEMTGWHCSTLRDVQVQCVRSATVWLAYRLHR